MADQTIADTEQAIELRGVPRGHALLHDTDEKSTQQIDRENNQSRNSVAADELGRAVHGAVKIGFFLRPQAALAGFGFIDQAGIQIGVDGHLLARHGVEGEARRHFGDARRAFGDNHEVDDDQNREDDETDGIIAGDDELAEGFDDMAGGRRALFAAQQNQAGGGNVKR